MHFNLKNLAHKCQRFKNTDQIKQNRFVLLGSNEMVQSNLQILGDSPFRKQQGTELQCCCVLLATCTLPPNKSASYNWYHAFWHQFFLYGTCFCVCVVCVCCRCIKKQQYQSKSKNVSLINHWISFLLLFQQLMTCNLYSESKTGLR